MTSFTHSCDFYFLIKSILKHFYFWYHHCLECTWRSWISLKWKQPFTFWTNFGTLSNLSLQIIEPKTWDHPKLLIIGIRSHAASWDIMSRRVRIPDLNELYDPKWHFLSSWNSAEMAKEKLGFLRKNLKLTNVIC